MCRIYIRRNGHQQFNDLYEAFRTSSPGADVVWDRRLRDQRSPNPVVLSVERRGRERRSEPPTSWSMLGFVVAEVNDGPTKRTSYSHVGPVSSPSSRCRPQGQGAWPADPLKDAVVRIAEDLVREIVDRLNEPVAVNVSVALSTAGEIGRAHV